MFTFETSDPKEVRRFRIAQFNGRTATLRSVGRLVGHRSRPVDCRKQVERSGRVGHHHHPGRAQGRHRNAACAPHPGVRGRFLLSRRIFRRKARGYLQIRQTRHRACWLRLTGSASPPPKMPG